MTASTFIELRDAYSAGHIKFVIGMQQRAEQYAADFEAAWQRRQEARKEATKQWQDVILPAIKREAALRSYERELAARHSGTVPGPAA